MTVTEALQGMVAAFDPEQAKGINAVVQLNTTGEGGGAHHINIESGHAELVEGAAIEPTVTITTAAKDWLSIVAGTLDATKAFMTGKLKVDGDLSLMMRFQRMFNDVPK